uniref:Uncharacterized protein n=1 Tax=Fagus sylvatica TaxID=28930 RepID=A0A2N9EKT5_FAGSY
MAKKCFKAYYACSYSATLLVATKFNLADNGMCTPSGAIRRTPTLTPANLSASGMENLGGNCKSASLEIPPMVAR